MSGYTFDISTKSGSIPYENASDFLSMLGQIEYDIGSFRDPV